ncbi:phBC6A51 family helix-turn-helix protein [Cytobacillus horneckiae]|uniref:phBC6A51 family helix-turn-helix protein n=1 Tax=Cytobacillus horneckiae TaxID=549687 RepID=UPI0034CE5B28
METGKFNAKQKEAIKLLAAKTMTKQQIADLLDVSRTTLWYWHKDPDFVREVNNFERELENFGNLLIKSKTLEAIEGYWNLTKDSKNDMVRRNGYEYFLNRSLGKMPETIHHTNDTSQTSAGKDILEAEQEEWEQQMIEQMNNEE